MKELIEEDRRLEAMEKEEEGKRKRKRKRKRRKEVFLP
jgi:hypothetical protein